LGTDTDSVTDLDMLYVVANPHGFPHNFVTDTTS
jgi:hypothetical protein